MPETPKQGHSLPDRYYQDPGPKAYGRVSLNSRRIDRPTPVRDRGRLLRLKDNAHVILCLCFPDNNGEFCRASLNIAGWTSNGAFELERIEEVE